MEEDFEHHDRTIPSTPRSFWYVPRTEIPRLYVEREDFLNPDPYPTTLTSPPALRRDLVKACRQGSWRDRSEIATATGGSAWSEPRWRSQ